LLKASIHAIDSSKLIQTHLDQQCHIQPRNTPIPNRLIDTPENLQIPSNEPDKNLEVLLFEEEPRALRVRILV